jgi:predicted RND superfamily exporter protein
VSSFILLGSVLLYGSLKLEIDDDLYDKFVGSHPLSQASQFYRKHFGFVSSVDLVYPLTEFPPSKEQLGKIAKLENKVRELELVSDISSFLKYEDFLGRLYDKDDSERARSLTYLLDDYGVFNGLYGEQASVLRSTVLINSSSSKELEATLGKIRTLIKPSSGVRLQGFVVMRTFLYNKIVENFLVSFAISFVVIFFIFVLLFRKFSWALVAMIPNLLPLILIFGMMGFLDIKMEGSLVMLVCVTIGIAVDDTIHFMYAIKSRLAESVPIELAIKQAFHQTSKALVGTTLIFVMSFPCLLLSELKLSMQMGVFIMFSLLMALLADFVLLPVLLLRFSRTQKNTHTP